MSLLGKKSEGPLMAHRGSSEEHVSRAAPAEKPSLLQDQGMLRQRMVRQHVGFCKKN